MNVIPEKELTLLNQDVSASMLTCESAWAGFCDPRLAEQMGVAPVMYGEVVKGETINWYMNPALMQQLISAARVCLLKSKTLIGELERETESCANEIENYTRTVVQTLEQDGADAHVKVLKKIK